MFTTLLESNRRSPRAAAQGVISLALHVGLGVGAVQATRQVVTAVPIRVEPISLIDEPSRPTPPDPTPTTSEPVGPTRLPSDPIFVSPPAGPVDGIPPIQIGEPIDSRRFVVGSPIPPSCLTGCRAADSTGGSVYLEDRVDEPASVVTQATPVYPPILKAAGIEGRVVLQFVVDTTGAVEPESIKTIETSHGGFEASAREAILASRFTPARIRGAAVRQLVRQGISFRVDR